jgi:hypothetical protein
MAINPLFMPQAMSSLMGPRQEDAVATPGDQPITPQLSPTAKYVQDMQRLMSGDIRQALTGGEKLMALGALLRSGARRSQTTPQEVMQNVRQTAQGRVASQLQLAQLQEKAAREAQQRAFIDRYSDALPEAKRDLLKNLDSAEAMKTVREELFRPKQVMKYIRDAATGKMRIEFQDGSSQLTDRDMPRNTKDRDIGDAIQVVDTDTGEVVATVPKRMAPGEAARLGLAERQFKWQQQQPSYGPAPTIRELGAGPYGGAGVYSFDPRNPTKMTRIGAAPTSDTQALAALAKELAARRGK